MLPRVRSPQFRALALLVQVAALCCQLIEGTGREHCPHHDLPASSAMATAMATMAHGAGHEHHQDHDRNHTCRCLGDCATAYAALASAGVDPMRVSDPGRAEVAVPKTESSPAPQYRLPPSIGPPRSA